VFRYDAGLRIGMGHHSRCRALSSWLNGDAISFIVGVDDVGREALSSNGDTFCLPVDMAVEQELNWWSAKRICADAIIFDLSYPGRTEYSDASVRLMRRVGDGSPLRFVIDAIGSQALIHADAAVSFDAIVIPYADGNAFGAARPVLAGAKYFMIPRTWPTRVAREPTQKVRHVLITMGGSDPHRLTLRALEAVLQIAPFDWSIRAIIGPAFDRTHVDAIRNLASGDRRIEVLEAPVDMAFQLHWAHLAVATTGLTKYEFAWAGLASVQISIDRMHAALNESFATQETAIHLGAAEDIETGDIASAVSALSADAPRRAAMSERGYALVDGEGGARVAKVFRKIIDARH
jgi:spore coat polysaccharide biosynthesis predicted glycosyltransferase SpsG